MGMTTIRKEHARYRVAADHTLKSSEEADEISYRTRPMVYTLLRDPQALSSELAALGTLQPRAFGSLKSCIDLGLVL